MSAAKIAMTASQARNNIRYIEPPSALPDSEQTIVSDQSFFMILPRQLGGFSRNGERGGTGPILGRLPLCVGQAEGQVVIDVDPDTLEELLILVGIVVVVGMLLWKAFR